MTMLDLYVIPGCPYCKVVTDYMDEAGIEYRELNIHTDPEAKQHLVDIGGKAQCPCLFIDGEPMYESRDILDYLQSLID